MAERDVEIEKISRRLQSLELRLNQLETVLQITDRRAPVVTGEEANPVIKRSGTDISDVEDTAIESQIGRFGLAWMGNIVLLFGITFLTQYLYGNGNQFLSIIFGYTASAGIFLLAELLKKSNVHLTFMFRMNAQVLLFYITLRLHFFTSSPLLSNFPLAIFLLLLIVAFQAFLAIRSKSQPFGTLSVFFALTAAMVSDKTHFMLPLVVLTAGGAIYYNYRFGWKPLLFGAIFLSYSVFFLWLFGNPFMGHPMQLIADQQFGVLYLFAIGGLFSALLYFRLKDSSSDEFLVGVTFSNGILFTFLLLIAVLRFYSTSYVPLFGIITVFCLTYSVLLHSRSDWNFASAYYALYGFMAMSIALYGLYGYPQVYLLLTFQSLLVVSMALWFGNRLIVVMNSLLFLSILGGYLFSSKSVDGVNFSFALIALISARVINWQRSRLHIETDMLRNLYMFEGFFMMLFALLHAVPKQFVTLSWTMAALLYFLISILLKNIKYRYMALGTIICSALYLFIVDLARIEIIYRVLALLFLAAISIGISIYYTNRVKKTEN